MSNKTVDPAALPVAGRETDWDAVLAITREQSDSAAAADPNAPPLPDARTMRRMVVSKRLRLVQGLSIAAFGAKYHIPEALLSQWESHAAEPDIVAAAYLAAIAADPEGVAAAVSAMPGQPAAAE
jgi:DNA-binding transcriptional regulator YiaG